VVGFWGGCGGVGVWWCGGGVVVGCWGGCGGVGCVVVWWWGVWWCGGGGSPLALEHSKVCTLCDFGHLQFVPFKKVANCHKLKPN
jgi:hypothetical protein